MEIKRFTALPDDARRIRSEVFLEEQHFSEEFDDTDNIAAHLVMYDGGTPVAVCRYFFSEEKNCYMIGRVAVAKDFRGRSLGTLIMQEAERLIKEEGGTEAALSAQCRVSRFYESLGYKKASEEYFDEYCPHILMKKSLI